MIYSEIARNLVIHVLDKMNNLDITVNDLKDGISSRPNIDFTIKNSIISGFSHTLNKVNDDTEINWQTGDFIESFCTDISFEIRRIDQQIININTMVASNLQPAWILISVYYCCFYICNLFSKLSGEYIINFNKEQFRKIKENHGFEIVNVSSSNGSDGGNTPLLFCLSSGDNSNELKILLKSKFSQKRPHEFAWTNFANILKDVRTSNKLLWALLLYTNTCNGSFLKKPNVVRNTWNYTNPDYFHEFGTSEAKIFSKMLTDKKLIDNWMKSKKNIRKDVSSTDLDEAAYIACLYMTLVEAKEIFISKIS